MLSRLSFALPGLILAAACHAQEAPHRFDLMLVGDINLGRLVRTEINLSDTSPWHDVLAALPKASIQVGNLEGVIEEKGSTCLKPDDYCFHFPAAHLKYLSDAGFTHLGLANNHALDQGVSGLSNSKSALNKVDMTAGVLSESPYFVTSKDVRYGLVFVNRVGKAQDEIPSPRLIQALDLAKANADWVIVYIHWGNELATWASSSQRDDAKWLIRHGADMIVGSHPHVIQPVDCVEGHPVWFSLGNHVFDQKYLSTHSGGLIACDGTDSLSCQGYRTTRDENSAGLRTITADASLNTPAECIPSRKQKQPLQLSGISLSLSDTRQLVSSSVLDLNIGNAKEYGMHNLPLRRIATFHLPSGEQTLFLLLDLYSDIDSVKGVRPHVYRVSQNGIQPLWRGSGLAYPLIDAVPITNGKHDTLCALHARGSFLAGPQTDQPPFVMAYKWNGFGFSAERSEEILHKCQAAFNSVSNRSIQPDSQSVTGIQPVHVLNK